MSVSTVSVIMSTYNETLSQLKKSVSSILNQTWKDFEYIIVNDNPKRKELNNYLNNISDNRVKIIINDDNRGLVYSLNRALSEATGEIIARMDADDIAISNRLELQMSYLRSNELDLIGCDVALIDDDDNITQSLMHFPSKHEDIVKHMKWGNCIAHPTWFVRKDVMDNMGGYRNAPYCEDYDFILRVISSNEYKIGNMPKIGLKYRIRSNGISQSNVSNQYILRRFLSKNKKVINHLSERDMIKYIESKKFKSNVMLYMKFLEDRNKIKKNNSLHVDINLALNKYTYIHILEMKKLKKRETL